MSVYRWLSERYRVATQPLRTERRIELLAIVLLLALLLQLMVGLASLGLQSAPEAIAPAPDTLQLVDFPDRVAVSAAQSNEIRSRPLLWPSRRPEKSVVELPEITTEKASNLSEMSLVGVFGAGDSAGIIVRVEGKARRLRRGDELLGWTLESVAEKEIVLKNGNRRETLVLEPAMAPTANVKSRK